MNIRKLKYLLHSGKNPKFLYYAKSALLLRLPLPVLRPFCTRSVVGVEARRDYGHIADRVDYYCRLRPGCVADREAWARRSVSLSEQPVTRQKVYYIDAMAYARWFPMDSRWILLPGDITYSPDLPSIVKSRPIGGNANSVVLNLDRIRHFIFVRDRRGFRDKADRAVFRGKVRDKALRMAFMERFFGNGRFDVGTIDTVRPEWKCEKMSIYDHLAYRYILCLEGNDVASNLKWVMSSNSVAVMPRPRYETWFMEGRLKPGYHYIEVAPDFSDLEAKMDYYSAHPGEAEAIVEHAHAYVGQFRDAARESLISMLVLDKYFKMTGC